MKNRTADAITAFIAGLLAILCLYLFMQEAGATGSYSESKQRMSEAWQESCAK